MGFDVCPKSNICTEPITEGSSICSMDIGGPLFTLKCGSKEASCLYGVASYFDSLPPPSGSAGSKLICNGGSIFANIVEHFDWIATTIGFN